MLDNLAHNDAIYALAIEHEDYRAAARQAIRAIRRIQRQGHTPEDLWLVRFRGAFARRHGVA